MMSDNLVIFGGLKDLRMERKDYVAAEEFAKTHENGMNAHILRHRAEIERNARKGRRCFVFIDATTRNITSHVALKAAAPRKITKRHLARYALAKMIPVHWAEPGSGMDVVCPLPWTDWHAVFAEQLRNSEAFVDLRFSVT